MQGKLRGGAQRGGIHHLLTLRKNVARASTVGVRGVFTRRNAIFVSVSYGMPLSFETVLHVPLHAVSCFKTKSSSLWYAPEIEVVMPQLSHKWLNRSSLKWLLFLGMIF